MKYTNFIARRYLFERKRVSLINTLTGISITGVTLGTALLIVVLSVFNGFFDVVKELLLSYDPDIRVEATTGRTMNMTPADVERLRNLPDIATVAPYTSGRVMLTQRGKNDQVENDGDGHSRFSRWWQCAEWRAGQWNTTLLP